MTAMQLNCFLTIAETLNFTQAASHLNMTQPAVTQQIHSLEDELGVRLFKRTTRTVELTPEGYVFWNDAKNVLNAIIRAKSRFKEPANGERVPLTIGCHNHGEFNLLPDILRKMLEQFPALYPVFQVVPFHRLFQLLKEDTVDVLLSFRENIPKKSRGTYKKIAKVNTVAVLPPDLPLSQKPSLSKADLKSEKIVVLNPQIASDRFNVVRQELMEGRPMAEIYVRDSVEGCITLARAGFGIAVLPNQPIRHTLHRRQLFFCRADQDDGALFNERQKSVLLRFIEPVDLIHKQDGPDPHLPVSFRRLHDDLDLFDPGYHSGKIHRPAIRTRRFNQCFL